MADETMDMVEADPQAEAVVASQGEDLQDPLDEDLTSVCRLACETLA